MLQHCSGRRGATDTLFHNNGDLFRKFGGKVPFLSMCQQVLSKIVAARTAMILLNAPFLVYFVLRNNPKCLCGPDSNPVSQFLFLVMAYGTEGLTAARAVFNRMNYCLGFGH